MTENNNKKKLGIIQSRGLGDIVIALPIALHYYNEGWEVYWPIDEQFLGSVQDTADWVNWISLKTDNTGKYFYDKPLELLYDAGCDDIICLYQSLTGHPEFVARPEFQITKFDQLKYHVAQVPFIKKWALSECISRDHVREQDLYDKVVNKEGNPYAVVHKKGSNAEAIIDPAWIPEGWQTIEIDAQTDCVFDWLRVLEGADAIIAIDSVIANIVDQLQITEHVDCYFIPRSHIHLTPVLGGSWTVLDPDAETKKRITIFRSG